MRRLLQVRHCETVLLSYPRSGNHLVRYLLEYSFARPTLGANDSERFLKPRGLHDMPIFLRAPGIEIRNRRPIVVKRHVIRPTVRFSRVVLLVRDPVEAILSHTRSAADDVFFASVQKEVDSWLATVDYFLTFPPERRCFVRLEKLYQEPHTVGETLITFLGGDSREIARFEHAWENREAAKTSLARKPRDTALPYRDAFPERSEKVLSLLRKHASTLDAVSISLQ